MSADKEYAVTVAAHWYDNSTVFGLAQQHSCVENHFIGPGMGTGGLRELGSTCHH